jgi:hypothetical protein
MAALKAPAANESQLPAVTMGFGSLQSFELMQRAAKLLSAASLVPTNYQGNIPNCVIALNMAQRLGADPLMVMQNLYVVHGRPGWSAKFLIASFNQCGRFSAVKYIFSGTPGNDDWSCVATSKEYSTTDTIVGPKISIALAKKEGWYQKNGSKWQSIPELMLMYRAAAWMINTHAPEISMGLLTQEEIHDTFDAKRGAGGAFEVDLDDLRQPGAPAIEPTPDAPYVFDHAPVIKALRESDKPDVLKHTWEAIVEECNAHNVKVPIEVEAVYHEQREKVSKPAKAEKL